MLAKAFCFSSSHVPSTRHPYRSPLGYLATDADADGEGGRSASRDAVQFSQLSPFPCLGTYSWQTFAECSGDKDKTTCNMADVNNNKLQISHLNLISLLISPADRVSRKLF